MSKFVAVDIGSSFVKAALFDVSSPAVLEHIKEAAPCKLPNDNPNKFEVKANLYVEIVTKILKDLSAKYNDLQGLILSTQMHGFVYEKQIDDDPLYISWQDQRCIDLMPDSQLSFLDYLKSIISPEKMESCGVYLKPSMGFCNLYAMLKADPSIKRDGRLYTLGSYISYKLTGNNVCHRQNAAPLGLVNIAENKWNYELLELAGIPEIKLPELAKSDSEVVGRFKINGADISVYPDFGDQQISVLGSNLQDNEALINIATACQVICKSDSIDKGLFETRPYFAGSYIKTISNMPSGRGLDVIINFIKDTVEKVSGKEIKAADIWNAVHDSYQKDSHGLTVDPRFYATYDHMTGGAISHINSSNLRISNIFASLFDEMAKTYWQTIQTLTDKEKLTKIICAGGVSWRLPELLEKIRETALKPCTLSPMEDEALIGLFLISLYCHDPSKSLVDYSADIANFVAKR